MELDGDSAFDTWGRISGFQERRICFYKLINKKIVMVVTGFTMTTPCIIRI